MLARYRVPTGASQGYGHILGQVAELAAAAGYRPAALGIGTPGTIVPRTGFRKNCNATVLNGRPVRTNLELPQGRQLERKLPRSGSSSGVPIE